VAYLPLRPVSVSDEARDAYDAWVAGIEAELDRPDCDRNELCRRVLTELHFPQLVGMDPQAIPEAFRIPVLNLDPRNVTMEPEYYRDTDLERYAPIKPLIWMWEMFDKSAVGENVHLGVLFRRALAKRIFRSCGKNLKIFHHVKISFGYNLEVGNDVVIHRHALLDDRGGIRLGHGASVSDFVNIYSHSHDLVDACEVATPLTTIGDRVRLAYHSTVLSGVAVGENTLLGAHATLTKDAEPHSVYVGTPARKVRDKPDGTPRKAPPDPLSEAGRAAGGCL
jgi:acetyltransferase-like isoleucine patch superfamily enzyme